MGRESQAGRDAKRAYRREYGSFIARETGTDYIPAVAEFDPRVQRLPDRIAESLGALGRMPHGVALQEAEAHLASVARGQDADPACDPRAYMLQRLARSRLFPLAQAAARIEGMECLALGMVMAAIDRHA